MSDKTAPDLTSLMLTPKIDVSTGKGVLKVDISTSEDISGIKQVNLWFEEKLSYGQTAESSYPDGTWSVMTFPGLFDSWSDFKVSEERSFFKHSISNGVHLIDRITIEDGAGNINTYYNSDLLSLGFPNQFEVSGASNSLPEGSISILGDFNEGATLTTSNTLSDSDGLGTFSYQWLRDGSIITGATSSTYITSASDVGSALSVTVSYIDEYGTEETVTSTETSPIQSSAPTTNTHSSLILVDAGVISDDPIWIKGVLEEITKSNNIEIEHKLTVNGQTYQYEEVDALISVVTRDDQFTEEFQNEIRDLAPTFSSVTYAEVVNLVGVLNIDSVLLHIAGSDGSFVA